MDYKYYKVIKVNSENGKETNYGTMCEEDMKLVTRGYSFDGLIYNRQGSKYFFIVEEVK